MKTDMLPLFPLQVVLFPHAALPLHIFEERYRALLRMVIKESVEFGIVLTKGEDLSEIGCSAAVTSVMQMYEDGRMDVLVEGRRRFRILQVDDTRAQYLMGSVAYLEDRGELPDAARFAETVQMYNQLVELVYAGKVKMLDPETVLPDLSFVMAQKAGMDLDQRQQLLELDTEEERLALLREYLTAVLPRLKKLEEVDRIIRSDGYL
ncbi:MAG: LON peptidase substrate-binding domain-containing protein [Bacteroidetes bacterium]|nr:LON peptidase substrate-binding domain-containing protein [Bacteroidota bacterium]